MSFSNKKRIEIPLASICNMHFLRFICNRSAFISFRRDDWNKKMGKSQPERLYESMKKIFHMNPVFETYLFLNENLTQWRYPTYPEDPAFYREDKSCILHVNVHEGLCFYYPKNESELHQLMVYGLYNQEES